jgi:hypothetical protein
LRKNFRSGFKTHRVVFQNYRHELEDIIPKAKIQMPIEGVFRLCLGVLCLK